MAADEPKAQFRGELSTGDLDRIRRTCLYVATVLGDYADETVVIGGLVPSLLISSLPPGTEAHAGTKDLDLGLSLAVLDEEKYKAISARLRGAGFEPDVNKKGRPIRQRWRLALHAVTVDFLLPPPRPNARAGSIQSLEDDFAAVVIPGVQLAFTDGTVIRLAGMTIKNEKAEREVKVCGAGAFVVLKALAFDKRGERKDAYDLVYMLRNFGDGPRDVAKRLKNLRGAYETNRALEILVRDFLDVDHTGPIRAAEFFLGVDARDDRLQADAVAAVREFLAVVYKI